MRDINSLSQFPYQVVAERRDDDLPCAFFVSTSGSPDDYTGVNSNRAVAAWRSSATPSRANIILRWVLYRLVIFCFFAFRRAI